MRERVPVAVSESKLTVRGPSYLELSVDATVRTDGHQATTGVQETVIETLTEFTHPLTGGPDGDGWAIGTVPSPGDCVARVERLEQVTRVTNLSVTYDGAREDATLFAGEGAPVVPDDVLVHSGRHAVRVEIAG